MRLRCEDHGLTVNVDGPHRSVNIILARGANNSKKGPCQLLLATDPQPGEIPNRTGTIVCHAVKEGD